MPTPSNVEAVKSSARRYYQFCPEVTVPLVHFCLAIKGEIRIEYSQEPIRSAYRSLSIVDIRTSKWYDVCPADVRRLSEGLSKDVRYINLLLTLNPVTSDIFSLFHTYDNKTLLEEHYFRYGSHLIHHTDKYVENTLQCNYEEMAFVDCVLRSGITEPSDIADIYNLLLELSHLQPTRPRLSIARTIRKLLGKAEGTAYYPFAGIGIAGALMAHLPNLYSDGDEEKLTAAGRLLYYALDADYTHFVKRDSKNWKNDQKLDIVFSTYRGFLREEPALCFCLRKCEETWSDRGVYVGVITSDKLFGNSYPVIQEAIQNDLLDTIVITPYNESVVRFSLRKEEKGTIKIYDFSQNEHAFTKELNGAADFVSKPIVIRRSAIIRKNFKLQSFVHRRMPSDTRFITLSRMAYACEYGYFNIDPEGPRKSALLSIDRSLSYEKIEDKWNVGLKWSPIKDLQHPAYKINGPALIITSADRLEFRFFMPPSQASQCDFYLTNGIALGLDLSADIGWDYRYDDNDKIGILHMLLERPYIKSQLFPFGIDHLCQNELKVASLLKLKIAVPNQTKCSDQLPVNYTFSDPKSGYSYRILKNLGQGGFGLVYKAERFDTAIGPSDTEPEIVALKELFISRYMTRESGKIVFSDEKDYNSLPVYTKDFINESKIYTGLGSNPSNHITHGLGCFFCDKTYSMFIVMKYYGNGSFEDCMSITEDEVINQIIRPVCKALSVVHRYNILHCDIKPENLLKDENGNAVLSDFGIIKAYKSNGEEKDDYGPGGTSWYMAPEQKGGYGHLQEFSAATDIYAFAGTIYTIVTGEKPPQPIIEFSDVEKNEKMRPIRLEGFSKKFADAVASGLMQGPKSRPQSALEFLRMFPGCEDAEL